MATDVFTVRLTEHEVGHVRDLSKEERKDRSAALRQLVELGWRYRILHAYSRGKLSLETAAKKIEMSMSELFDLLAELGIRSPITYDDYLAGEQGIRKLMKKS
jgi:predicted HTH domain antitoxin